MNGPALGIYGILVMVAAMLLLNIPAGFIMAIVGFVGIALTTSSLDAALSITGTEFWNVFSRYELSVIPMFVLVGEFIHYAGYSDQLYRAADKWIGHCRGGLATATIAACAAFSAICGSNSATAATMTAVAIPAMRRRGYNAVLMSGAVAAGSTLGVMIPPSIVLVVYGIYASQSIGKLFFGTLVPGITLAILMALTVTGICIRHPEWGPRDEKATWGERIRSLPAVIDVLVLFLVIMVALLTGVVTATEAAAVGCLLALGICLVRRRLSWQGFVSSVGDTLRISCMVFMIVAGATLFGRFMAITRLPFEAAAWIGGLHWPGWAILLMMMVFYIIGGCFMDALAFLLISLPIFAPIAAQLGYDPIWFGEVLTLVTTFGAITPPVGICCFVVAGMCKDVPMEKVFKGALYFVPAYIITFILEMVFPYWMVLAMAGLVR
jgi:C4-dicarboxylate transporter, DctM subunit